MWPGTITCTCARTGHGYEVQVRRDGKTDRQAGMAFFPHTPCVLPFVLGRSLALGLGVGRWLAVVLGGIGKWAGFSSGLLFFLVLWRWQGIVTL